MLNSKLVFVRLTKLKVWNSSRAKKKKKLTFYVMNKKRKLKIVFLDRYSFYIYPHHFFKKQLYTNFVCNIYKTIENLICFT